MNEFSFIFIAMVLLASAIELWLARRQSRSVMRHRDRVPAAFDGRIPLATHQKAADYTQAKMRLEYTNIISGALLVLVWTLGGGLALLADWWNVDSHASLLPGIGFMVSVLLISSLLSLPLDAYRTFGLEARFGFNRTTPRLFISDLLKQGLLFILIGVPVIALLFWLLASSGMWWWLLGWAAWMGLSLIMMWAYPAWIAPLFNKFSPLQDQNLHRRIVGLLERCGFASSGIFVMDGSTRSQHGNAYFTGFGANKRIVFFDTLLKTLTPDEIEAVLAHELGHFKHGHITQRLLMMAVTTFIGFAALGWLSGQTWFYQGLGMPEASAPALLLLFLFAAPYFTILFHPLSAYWMRKHEFEADAFAARQTRAQPLIDALVKLYEENAATLTPDPWYSAYHDSHPPAPVRIAQLAAHSRSG